MGIIVVAAKYFWHKISYTRSRRRGETTRPAHKHQRGEIFGISSEKFPTLWVRSFIIKNNHTAKKAKCVIIGLRPCQANDWMCFIKYVTWIIIFTYLRPPLSRGLCFPHMVSAGKWNGNPSRALSKSNIFQRPANDGKMSYRERVRSADLWSDLGPHSAPNPRTGCQK